MSRKISTTNLGVAIVFTAIFFFHSVGEADSFPFRAINVGDKLPVVTVREIGSQKDVSLENFAGKTLLLVFFGADNQDKKLRAIKLLKAVQELASFTTDKAVAIVVVDAQDDSAEVVKEVVAAAGFSGTVYADIDRQVYGSLGIFVMPSILLVAADGQVAAGLGYSRDLAKRIKGEIEILTGDKTRAQVEEELHPQMVEKSPEAKGAGRHFRQGMTMMKRGQTESALREFGRAVALAPDLGEAHIYLGCLQLDGGKTEEARASLAKGLEFAPDSVEGQICLARIKAESGDLDGALEDVGSLLLRNSRNDNLHYVLGKILEIKADQSGAAAEYRKAYELLEKKCLAK